MSLYQRKLVNDAIRYFPGRVIPAIIGFFSLIAFTRILGPEEYGNYSIVLTTLSIFGIVAESWLISSSVRYFPHGKTEQIPEYIFSIIVGLLISLTVVVILMVGTIPLIVRLMRENTIADLLLWAVPAMVFFSTVRVINNVFRAGMHSGKYAFFSILFAVFKGGVAIAFIIIFHPDAKWVFIGFSLAGLITVIPMVFQLVRSFGWSQISIPDIELKRFFHYGWPFTLLALSSWLLGLFNRYVIKGFYTSYEVGVYSAVQSLIDQSLSFVFMALMLSVYPLLVKAWNEQGPEFTADLLSQYIRYFAVTALPIAVSILVFGKEIITIVMSSEFSSGYGIAPWLVMTSFLVGFSQYLAKPMELAGKTGLLALVMVSAGLLNGTLAFVFVPRYGIMGAATVSFFTYLVLCVVQLVIDRKHLHILIKFANTIGVIKSALLMYLVMFLVALFFGKSITMITIALGIGAVAYVTGLRIFEGLSAQEMNKILELIKIKH